jgi:hypothetical protein
MRAMTGLGHQRRSGHLVPSSASPTAPDPFRSTRTRGFGMTSAEQAAYCPCRSWAGYITTMFEFEFATTPLPDPFRTLHERFAADV